MTDRAASVYARRLEGAIMTGITASPTSPLQPDAMAWIETGPGESFRPLRFEEDGFSDLIRLEPGAVMPRHRHTGDTHIFNLQGSRELIQTGEIAGPGDYVYEPPGTVDSWRTAGDVPCIVHVKVVGVVEYLDANDQVAVLVDSASERAAYLAGCERQGVDPDPQLLH
jgi:2,4'-dihydroxyacetophenone dioxygenase